MGRKLFCIKSFRGYDIYGKLHIFEKDKYYNYEERSLVTNVGGYKFYNSEIPTYFQKHFKLPIGAIILN